MVAVKKLDTRVADVSIDQNDVICVRLKDCGLVDEFDVINLNIAIRHLCNGSPRLKMIIASDDWNMDKAARKRAEGEDRSTLTIARAIVVSGRIKAAIYNYMVSFNKNSPFPSQFFYNEDEAYQWLKSFSVSE